MGQVNSSGKVFSPFFFVGGGGGGLGVGYIC